LGSLLFFAVTAWGDEGIEHRFTQALRELDQNPQLAAEMLSVLNAKASTPRIKLELARALFMTGRFDEARAMFKDVLLALPPNAPRQVRTNIEQFLGAIDRQLNPLSFGLSWVQDSNPAQSSQTQKINLFGLEFDYQPTKPAKTEHGARFSVNYTHRPHDRVELQAYAAFTQYQTKNHTRAFVTPELKVLVLPQHRLWARAGYEFEGQNNQSLRHGVFAGLRKLDFWPSLQLSTMADVRVVDNRYPDYEFLNGPTVEVQALASKRLHRKLRMTVGAGVDDVNAKDKAYGTLALWGSAGLTVYDLWAGLDVSYTVRAKNRRFDELDGFFGVRRYDIDTTHTVGFEKSNWYVWGFKPSVQVVYETRKSNIPIARFERTQLVVTGNKLF
jgi:hypothetical protein